MDGLTGPVDGLGGLRFFFFIIIIFGRLTKVRKAIASVKPLLAKAFDWRRLQCPSPLTLFAHLHRILQ